MIAKIMKASKYEARGSVIDNAFYMNVNIVLCEAITLR